jgi:acyl-CoA thioester hydrolase
MTDSALLRLHTETVQPDWVDYNGHMNVAYYVLVFDHATDVFLNQVGMDATLRETTGSSVFVAEAHITYDQEVMEGEQVYITTQLLAYDEKRLHIFHRMHRATDDALAATNELMILQVNLNDRRVGPFHEDVRERIAAIAKQQAGLAMPDAAGRQISIRRK